jgi:dihydroneopterin aldolase
MENEDCIYIKNFDCPAYIGLYDHEKGAMQPLVLHLELYGKWSVPTFLDYDLIIEKIKQIIAKQHYDLLENLAESLAETLLSTFPIQRLILAIDKPLAVKHALVGVKIERSA